MYRAPKTTEKKRRPVWARVLVAFGWVLVIAVGLVAATGLGFFGSGALRQPVLVRVLAAVDQAVPGHLTYRTATWADVGTIVVDDVRWIVERAEPDPGADTLRVVPSLGMGASETSPPGPGAPGAATPGPGAPGVAASGATAPGADAIVDTLAAADRILLQVDLPSLLRRRIRVIEFSGHAIDLDIPAIQSALAAVAKQGGEKAPREGQSTIPFFRPGFVPYVPAASVDRFALDFARVRLAPDRILSGEAELQVDVTQESGGRIVIGPLDLAVQAPGPASGGDPARIETRLSGSLQLDLQSGEAAGRLELLWEPDWRALLTIAPVSADQFQLRLTDQATATPAPSASADSVSLVLDVSLTREDLSLRAIDLHGDLHLPAPAELSRRPFVSEIDGLPETGPIDARVEAAITLAPTFTVTGGFEFLPNALVDVARASGGYTSGTWRLEDVEIASRDARIEGKVEGRGDSLTADVSVRLDGAHFLEPWMTEPPPIESLRADLRIRAEGEAKGPGISLEGDASATIAGTEIEQFGLSGRTARWGAEPVAFDLFARAMGFAVTVAGELDEELTGVRLAPIQVREEPTPGHGRTGVSAHVADAPGSSGREAGAPGSSGSGAGAPGSTGGVAGAPASSGSASSGTSEDPAKNPGSGGAMSQADAGASPTNRVGWGSIDWTVGVVLRGVRVESDYGRATVDGAVDSTSRVTARARTQWAEVPEVLLERMKLRPGQSDSLRRAWRTDGPFSADASLLLDENAKRVRLILDLALPGPGTFVSVLPPDTRTEGLGPLTGRAQATGPSWEDLRVEGNLGGDGWLDRLHLSASLRGKVFAVDSLTVDLLGLGIEATGALGEQIDLRGSLDLPSLRRLGAILPALPESLDAHTRAAFALTGSPPRPEIDLQANGGLRFGELFVPQYTLSASRDGAPFHARLDLPAGLRTGGQEFERVFVELASASDSLFPLQLSLDARSRDLEGSAHLVLSRDGVAWLASADSLRLRALDRELVSRGPFTVRVDPEAERYEVRGLDLGGSVGELRADGFVEPGDAQIALQAELDLPPRPEKLSIPPEIWPQRIEAEIEAAGPRELSAVIRVDGLPLETGRLADLAVTARLALGRIDLAASVVADGDSLLRADGFLPGTVQLYPPELHVDPGDISFGLRAEGLPVRVPSPREVGRSEKLHVDANVDLHGTTAKPELRADVRAGFQEWPALSDFLVVGRASYAPSVDLPSLRTRFALVRPQAKGSGSGDSLLVASAEIPLRLNWQPFSLEFPPDETVRGSVTSSRLSLGDFSAILPPSISASGRLDMDLDVDGALRDPGVSGSVVARKLEGQLADGSRVAADGRLSVAGTALHPVIRGNVDVASGVIVIPETPKLLLPAKGDARLWALAHADSSENVDSNQRGDESDLKSAPAPGTVAAGSGTPPLPRPAPPQDLPTVRPKDVAADPPMVEPDLDVTIDIPGAVWIRGRGLEVELEGNIRVTYANAPVLTGTLQARSGHLRMLGRYFQVVSGVVGFYGEEEIDPVLDLQLSTRVDATTVYVDVTGTAKQPDLALRSDPEMEEGDIFSLLLLGRPLDQLDDDQTELLESRARDLALSFGATQVGSTLSGELGVDLVSLQPTSQGTGNALVIGKYLSPRILLKYEQAIQSTEDFLVNLEYLLTRRLRLETFYGRQSQSGAEINWISEY